MKPSNVTIPGQPISSTTSEKNGYEKSFPINTILLYSNPVFSWVGRPWVVKLVVGFDTIFTFSPTQQTLEIENNLVWYLTEPNSSVYVLYDIQRRYGIRAIAGVWRQKCVPEKYEAIRQQEMASPDYHPPTRVAVITSHRPI